VVGVITETDVFRAFIEMYRAGHSGLYLTLKVRDREEVIAELSKAVFGLGGNILSISSFCDETTGDYRLAIKGHDIDKDQVVAALESLGDHVIEAHEV
jgi:acetoin utilization protein AcuB